MTILRQHRVKEDILEDWIILHFLKKLNVMPLPKKRYPLMPSSVGISTSPSYLEGVIVLLPDLLVLLFQVLKVLFPNVLIQKL